MAFLGLGVVGSKVLQYIRSESNQIAKDYQVMPLVERVYVRDLNKQREVDVSDLVLTDDPYEAVEDADIVIECMGGNGAELTRELVLWCINHRKAVIMSSKKCLAINGAEIMDSVRRNKTPFGYDATVGGGIPISTVLAQVGKCEKVEEIYGICNATSNYILTRMSKEGLDFETSLQRAKEKGYAENNADEDVDGFDSLYKAVILAGFSLNQWVNCGQLRPRSIKEVTREEIHQANQQNSVIKPVFRIINNQTKVSIMVELGFISKEELLSTVDDNYNAIIICHSESGQRAYVGQGAGARPTASAMFDDMIKVIIHMANQEMLSIN